MENFQRDLERNISIIVDKQSQPFRLVHDLNLSRENKTKSITRVASRGICRRGNEYLMIYTPSEDSYEFPGGGSEKGETPDQTLRREMLEETGHRITKVGNLKLVYIEQKNDQFEPGKYFEMVNYIYDCEIEDQRADQQLDEWEKELNIRPCWIYLEKAIHANTQYCLSRQMQGEIWVLRSLIIMHKVLNNEI